VAGARVHIAMPQPALFTGSDKPTTASVVLKLRNNRQLDPATVNAITGLVSASVESLRPESVVVIDNFGHPLARPASDGDAGGGSALEQQRRIEQDLSTRLVALIEPIVGMGRVHVSVNAIINTASQEQTEERWDDTPVIRNQQTVTQSSNALNPGGTMPAVAGARANLPVPPPDGSGAAAAPPAPAVAMGAGGTSSSSQTVNYEVSKTVVRTVQPRGQVARLSVAVLLDDAHAPPAPGTTGPGTSTPRTAEELMRIRGLVAATVGLEEKRGDQLTVENVAFEETPIQEVAEPTLVERYQEQGFEALRIVGTLVVALLAILFIIRPIMRAVLPARTSAPVVAGGATTMQAKTVQEIEAEIDAEIEASIGTSVAKRLPALTRKATAITQKEPENAARLLRAWLTEEER
jgi:flagellar M-ring protein FliF